MELQATQLLLCSKTAQHYQAWEEQPAKLAELLNVEIAEGFPVFPEEMIAERSPVVVLTNAEQVWGAWFVITQRDPPRVIGTVGFHGPPNAEGVVEIGYSIVPGYRRQGLASEAVATLIEFAMNTGMVRQVRATTLSQDAASAGVLKANGFVQEGPAVEVNDPDEGVLVVQGWVKT